MGCEDKSHIPDDNQMINAKRRTLRRSLLILHTTYAGKIHRGTNAAFFHSLYVVPGRILSMLQLFHECPRREGEDK